MNSHELTYFLCFVSVCIFVAAYVVRNYSLKSHTDTILDETDYRKTREGTAVSALTAVARKWEERGRKAEAELGKKRLRVWRERIGILLIGFGLGVLCENRVGFTDRANTSLQDFDHDSLTFCMAQEKLQVTPMLNGSRAGMLTPLVLMADDDGNGRVSLDPCFDFFEQALLQVPRDDRYRIKH